MKPKAAILFTKQTFNCSKSTIRNTRKKCELYSKLAIKTPERPLLPPWKYQKTSNFLIFSEGIGRRSDVFIANFENISQLFSVFLLLTLSMYFFAEYVAVKVNFT